MHFELTQTPPGRSELVNELRQCLFIVLLNVVDDLTPLEYVPRPEVRTTFGRRAAAVREQKNNQLIVLCSKSWYRRKVFIVTVEVDDG